MATSKRQTKSGSKVRSAAAPKSSAVSDVKPKVEPKPKAVMFVSKQLNMFHPMQKVRFIPGKPVECKPDVWLESQMKAGLIKEA